MTQDLLHRIDRYLDSVPRSAASVERMGPLTLFVNGGHGWRYYARPTPGASRSVTTEDVRAVLDRQRELGQPEALEWLVEISPEVGAAARDAGLEVMERPLMHLTTGGFRPAPAPGGGRVRIATPDDDQALLTAVAEIGFANAGTIVGPVGTDTVRAVATGVDPDTAGFVRERLRRGLTVTAFLALDGTPVAVGSHQPLDGISEIVGVATLPAFRRRGMGAAVTSALVRDAMARGIDTVFLAAGDDEIARVYERVGFRTIGRAGTAAPRP